MKAIDAYDLIRSKDKDYKASVCREYPNFFAFHIGGVNVAIVNKDTKNIQLKEMYDLPHSGWKSAKL